MVQASIISAFILWRRSWSVTSVFAEENTRSPAHLADIRGIDNRSKAIVEKRLTSEKYWQKLGFTLIQKDFFVCGRETTKRRGFFKQAYMPLPIQFKLQFVATTNWIDSNLTFYEFELNWPTFQFNSIQSFELYETLAEMDDLPVIHLCLFRCGLVANSAPTRQSGLVPHKMLRVSLIEHVLKYVYRNGVTIWVLPQLSRLWGRLYQIPG